MRMTRVSLLTTLFAATTAVTSVATAGAAFVPSSSSSKSSSWGQAITSRKTTQLQQQPYSPEQIKKAGGGVPLVPPGDRRLFDPAVEGKLGGTDSLDQRLRYGSAYQGSTTTTTTSTAASFDSSSVDLKAAQHWLEDIGVPQNFAKPTDPAPAIVLGRVKLITDDAPGDIQHIVLRLPPGFHYVEGQSIYVIPPGIDRVSGKPHKPRLYSIASTRYGDLLDGTTVSLCVRRAEFIVNPETGETDPAKKGVCSNFLCDLRVGDTVQIAGPVGKTMLLPDDPSKDIIMVATGTGIAPFRAFLHRLFLEDTVARFLFTGKAWLILGVPTTGGLLYSQELEAMQQNADSQTGSLEVTYAISREMKNKKGSKLYVQDVLAERADELFDRLDKGAVIYFCGLKGMMPGILQALENVCAERGIDWSTKLKQLQSNHQWHVEVY